MTDLAAAAEEAAEPPPTVLGSPGSDPEKDRSSSPPRGGSPRSPPSSPSSPPRGGPSAPDAAESPGGGRVPRAAGSPEPPRAAGSPEVSDCDLSAVEVVKEGAEACHEASVDGLRALVARGPPVVQAYFAGLRPWAEFARLDPPESGQEARARAPRNLRRYQSNYVTLLVVTFFLTLLRESARLAVVCLIVLVWILSERCGLMDPSWNPRVGEVTATRRCRLLVLVFLSLGTLMACCGSAVLIAVGSWALLMMAHAALHPGGPGREVGREEAEKSGEEEDDEEAQALVEEEEEDVTGAAAPAEREAESAS